MHPFANPRTATIKVANISDPSDETAKRDFLFFRGEAGLPRVQRDRSKRTDGRGPGRSMVEAGRATAITRPSSLHHRVRDAEPHFLALEFVREPEGAKSYPCARSHCTQANRRHAPRALRCRFRSQLFPYCPTRELSWALVAEWVSAPNAGKFVFNNVFSAAGARAGMPAVFEVLRHPLTGNEPNTC